jgi:1-acyl-sn-glycerol-3-phosphate acyltransferase
MIVLTVVLLVSLPLWLLVAAALSPLVQGRLRPLRLLWIGLLHMVLESVILVELFGLWIASGFGLWIRRPFFQRIHYDLAQTYLVVFFREARRVLRLRIVTQGPAPDAHPGEPLLVACRHAGPGDSFTLMYALMHWYGREPRVVLKDTMAWDPMISVLLDRLPSRFISPNPRVGDDLESQIAELATNLDHNDAFVIFPEGGNFTPERRRRAIDKLRRLGLEAMAVRAERMGNVLAPRPGGLLAALEAAPEADVVLVAHTGLDHMLTIADVWRELPMDKQLIMRWWRVPREEIPSGREARIDWLFTRWEQIDRWIEEHRPVDLPPARGRS